VRSRRRGRVGEEGRREEDVTVALLMLLLQLLLVGGEGEKASTPTPPRPSLPEATAVGAAAASPEMDEKSIHPATSSGVILISLSAPKACSSLSKALFNPLAKCSYSNPGVGQKQKFRVSKTRMYWQVNGPATAASV